MMTYHVVVEAWPQAAMAPGYDRNIWTVSELREKIEYIHANPVRHGLVAHPREWQWSSWRAWDEGVDEPVPIDRESFPTL